MTARRLTLREFRVEFDLRDNAEFMEVLQEWDNEGGCYALCTCHAWLEPDGECEHGNPSVLRAMGMI